MSELHGSESSEPSRKRRRPALSCEQCRRRKVKCDRNNPCTQCIESRNLPCTYTADPRVSDRAIQPQGLSTPAPTTASTSSTRAGPSATGLTQDDSEVDTFCTYFQTPVPSPRDARPGPGSNPPKPGLSQSQVRSEPAMDSLEGRVLTLEQMLSGSLGNSSTQEDVIWAHTAVQSRISPAHKEGKLVKSRFVSQSHWMSSFHHFDKISKYGQNLEHPSTSEIYTLVKKCKAIGRAVKAEHQTSYAMPIFRDSVPPRNVSDLLIDHYFRHYESGTRIIHIPSFQGEYARYWESPQTTNDGFILKMLLMMAIGSVFCNDNIVKQMSLRETAKDWIFAAQAWLSGPREKTRLNVNGLQTFALLLLARQTNAVDGELIWCSAGALLRMGVQIGLHRDPKCFSRISPLQSENRRRLWATMLEINMQAALDSGMPSMISCQDFDTEPPSNIDDEDLDESTKSHPGSKPGTSYTQTSLQIILYGSMKTRLEILQQINDFRSETSYDNVLRLGAELTKHCQNLNSIVDKWLSTNPDRSPTVFERYTLDLSIRRFMLPLHRPFALKARTDPRYYFSRKVWMDTSLTMMSFEEDEDFSRILTVGRGVWREVAAHTGWVICYELISQLEEDGTSSFARQQNRAGREILYRALTSRISMMEKRIAENETNVKGHLFMNMALGQIEAMESGTSVEESIFKHAKSSLERCYELLKARVTFQPLDPEEPGQAPQAIENGQWDNSVANEFGYDFNQDDGLDLGIPEQWWLFSWAGDPTASAIP